MTNAKTVKLVELVYMFTKYLIEKGKTQMILSSEMEKTIFNYYMSYPFNNILHFNLNQILEAVLETKNQALISLFFVKNKSFEKFLHQIV